MTARVHTFVYKNVEDLELKVDVHFPSEQGTEPHPVLFWIHGGGCVQGRRQAVPPHMREAVSKYGIVVVSPDYRLAPQTRLPTILSDVGDAFLWATHALPTLLPVAVDPHRLVVSGSSVGGYLASWVGWGKTPSVPLGSPELRGIQALALIYPITTFNSRFWSEPREPYGGTLPSHITDDQRWKVFLDPSSPAVVNTDQNEWASLPVEAKTGRQRGQDPLRNLLYSYAQQFAPTYGLDRLNFSPEQISQGALEEYDVPHWLQAQYKRIQSSVGPNGPLRLFVVHGDADKAVDVAQGRQLAKLAAELGCQTVYEEVPGKDQ